MPIYVYRCDCGRVVEEFTHEYCPPANLVCNGCGGIAQRRLDMELGSVDSQQVENPRWSASMGVEPNQIPDAMRLFPGSEYHPVSGDLLIKNRKHKLDEMKRRGYTEYR